MHMTSLLCRHHSDLSSQTLPTPGCRATLHSSAQDWVFPLSRTEFQAGLCSGAWHTARLWSIAPFKQYQCFPSAPQWALLSKHHQQATKCQPSHQNHILHAVLSNLPGFFLPLCLSQTLEQTQISWFLSPCSVHSLLWSPLQWQVLGFWQRWGIASPVPQALPAGRPSPSCSLKNVLSQ